jgi:hypothetical protein
MRSSVVPRTHTAIPTRNSSKSTTPVCFVSNSWNRRSATHKTTGETTVKPTRPQNVWRKRVAHNSRTSQQPWQRKQLQERIFVNTRAWRSRGDVLQTAKPNRNDKGLGAHTQPSNRNFGGFSDTIHTKSSCTLNKTRRTCSSEAVTAGKRDEQRVNRLNGMHVTHPTPTNFQRNWQRSYSKTTKSTRGFTLKQLLTFLCCLARSHWNVA